MSAAIGSNERAAKTPMYGQVVVGPPGSGKTTYCNGMQQYLQLLGRHAVVINLDPANEGLGAVAAEAAKNQAEKDARAATHGGGGEENKQEENEDSWLPYTAIFDICQEVVDLSSVMEQMNLGPNGGLVYCMEYLEEHADEVLVKIQTRLASLMDNHKTTKTTPYILLDLPGQVELYTHSTVVQKLLEKLMRVLDLRLTAVQLVDAHYCTDATKFLSAALLGTTVMIRLELPVVNVLSKVDLLTAYGGTDSLVMDLDFFTACQDLDRLLPFLDPFANSNTAKNEDEQDFSVTNDEDDYTNDADFQKARQKRIQGKLARKHAKLHQAMAEVVDDYGLLTFLPLDISSAESVGRVLAKIDKANGFVFLANQQSNPSDDNGAAAPTVPHDLFQVAAQSDRGSYEANSVVREHLAKETIPELNRS